MANQYDPEVWWINRSCTSRVVRQLRLKDRFIRVLELEKENKRLKLEAHDLQKMIEFMVLESQEPHELEEK